MSVARKQRKKGASIKMSLMLAGIKVILQIIKHYNKQELFEVSKITEDQPAIAMTQLAEYDNTNRRKGFKPNNSIKYQLVCYKDGSDKSMVKTVVVR